MNTTLFDELYAYIKSKKTEVIVLFTVCLCLFGIWMFNDFVSFDAEGLYSYANGEQWYNQWIALDRWAFVFLKKLLGVQIINPYFSCTVFLLCFPLSSVLWGFLISLWQGRKSIKGDLLIFGLLYLSHPIWTLQFSYRNQMEVCAIVLVLMPIGLVCLTRWMEKHTKLDLFLGLVLIIFSFGAYQSFLFLYGEALAIYLLYYALSHSDKEVLKYFMQAVLFTVIAFAAYKLLAYGAVMHYGIEQTGYAQYLDQQILWGSQPASVCFNNIFTYMKHSMFGQANVFTPVYGILSVLFTIAAVCTGMHEKKNLGWIILADLGIILVPFLLCMVTANYVVVRSQFAFVVSLAFMAMALYQKAYVFLQEGKISRTVWQILLAGCILLICVPQFNQSARLMYSDYRVMAEDKEEMNAIYYRAMDLGARPGDAIVFLGDSKPIAEQTITTYEISGFSYFTVIEKDKIVEGMQAYGYDVVLPNTEQKAYGNSLRDTMPCWPEKGSIVVKDDLIVVKIG